MVFNAYDFTRDPDVDGDEAQQREGIMFEWHCRMIGQLGKLC